ncbi:MAG: PAS domain-containing protein [Rhodospirillaceae bacterium]|jgi:hypothetical protein|nr:PAS domain-containing protein [Rhodospirillaceae bacterium]MBT4489126.1 PAS domain-containing protein [Rhodospirillaceae bacterium]MBT5194372.1 PAS domain-containing protein [Rhodospirillaceae bacterium]MBT5896975.1 PAS domain-containing protein [Rhodospirillaceae bacterium]MBT6429527.1 PAS domain-containing protein [Rhodospirillaceae bacterium]
MQLMDDIRTRECHLFAAAWQRWRGADLVPRRSMVQIEDIANLLHLVSVIEVKSPEVATFRLAGTALCDAMGIELTGLNYFDFTTPEERGPRSARTCHLVNRPAGSHFVFPIVYRSGRLVPTEVLSFPVLPEDSSAPPQLFALSMSMEETRLEGTVAETDQLPLPEGFQFVDIGAGVPDADLGLASRPPAEMRLELVG